MLFGGVRMALVATALMATAFRRGNASAATR